MMKKKAVWATVLILTVVSAFAVVAYADPLVLRPVGRIRVSLEDYSLSGSTTARATWNPFIQVFDGSFSAELNTGTLAGVDFAAVIISPLNIPLSTLKTLGPGGITFWAYFYNCPTSNQQLIVEFVLDNGRVISGYASEPVVAGAIQCESGLGYPSSELWRQMKPTNQWYSSFAGPDPLIPDTWDINNPQNLAAWWGLPGFASARIIQLRISFWSDGGNRQVFIDNVIFVGRPIPLEPESVGLPPHQV